MSAQLTVLSIRTLKVVKLLREGKLSRAETELASIKEALGRLREQQEARASFKQGDG